MFCAPVCFTQTFLPPPHPNTYTHTHTFLLCQKTDIYVLKETMLDFQNSPPVLPLNKPSSTTETVPASTGFSGGFPQTIGPIVKNLAQVQSIIGMVFLFPCCLELFPGIVVFSNELSPHYQSTIASVLEF